MLPVYVLVALSGLLLAALGVPLWAGKVPPNVLYGFRTPRTLADPEVWYAVNRLTGRSLAVSGVIAAVLSLVIAVLPIFWPLVFVPLIPIGLGLLHSFWAASAYVADLDAKGWRPPVKQAEAPPARPKKREDQRRRNTE